MRIRILLLCAAASALAAVAARALAAAHRRRMRMRIVSVPESLGRRAQALRVRGPIRNRSAVGHYKITFESDLCPFSDHRLNMRLTVGLSRGDHRLGAAA